MLNLKKVIASICVLAMVLSTVAFGATYTDVAEDSAYYEAVETLNKLGIVTGYEDGTYKPEDGVTRAEMAALIARIQGYGETAKGAANTAFTDVPSSHWASGYIANASGMGIINGYGDGTFGPEDPVLYEQAVKMIMATLGYTPFADKNGGYPTGYLAAAQRYDVSLAVANAAVGQEANRGTVAQLLANAIDTPLMVQSKWNTNGEVEYIIADGKTYDYKTLMSENLGYIKLKGIVKENTISMVGAGTKTIDTTADVVVKIDVEDSYDTNNKAYLTYVGATGVGAGKEFLVGDTDAADYLGYKVIAYVKNVNGEFEIVSIAKDSNSNDTLTISLDQYYSNNGDPGATPVVPATEIEYYKDGANDTTEITVESGFNAVVNGIGMSGDSALALIAANTLKGGEMTFVDTDDVKGYDTVFVSIAVTGVVKKATEDGIDFRNTLNLINGDAPTTIEIDVEDETKVFELTKDGEVIDFSTLQDWDILSIYANSETADVIKAEVIGNKVVGTIDSTKKSSSSAYPSSAGLAYKVDNEWYDVAQGAYGASGLAIGEGGTFYIDQFGKIAAFDEDAALATGVAGTYAYVLGTSTKESDFGGSAKVDIKLQVLTADGIQILDFKNKTDVAGTDVDESDAGWTISAGVGTHTTFSSVISGLADDVVLITKTTNGEISKITTAASTGDRFILGDVTSTIAAAEFDADNSRFKDSGASIRLESDAIVFMIDSTDSKNSTVGALDAFEDEESYKVLATYKTKNGKKNDIVVVEDATIQIGAKAKLAVVTEVGTTTDDEGNSVKAIKYFIDGAEAEAKTSSDLTNTAALTVGDIIKVKVSNDVITSIKYVWNFVDGVRDVTSLANSINSYVTSTGLPGVGEAYVGGAMTDYDSDYSNAKFGTTDYNLVNDTVNTYVIDATGRELVIKKGGSIRWYDLLNGSATGLTVTDRDNTTDTVTGLTAAQARDYADHVYVRTYDGDVEDVIIVKGLNIKVD